jgi:CRISPR-associated endoribonuclease Cas6
MICLRPVNSININFEYHHNIQGFIYSLLINTSFHKLHDNKGQKFFCFSNVFKSKGANDHYNLIISSPSLKFIDQLYYELNKIQENQTLINIGKDYFFIQALRFVSNSNLSSPLNLTTSSPIIVRIPNSKMTETMNQNFVHKEVYWKPDYSLGLFINAVERNFKIKYEAFTGKTFDGRLIQTFNFKRTVSTNIHVAKTRIPIIATMWELGLCEDIPMDIQLFAMDSGLGERNPLGFGFLNPITAK